MSWHATQSDLFIGQETASSRYEKWEAAHFSMLEKVGTGEVTAMTRLRHRVRTYKHITVSPPKPGEFVYGMKSVLITADLQCSSRTCFL